MATVSETSLFLEKSFLKANADCYWHYVMKNCHNSTTYASDKIKDKIKAIESTGRKDCFQSKSVKGWTPLHVAAISGNKEGMKFLLSIPGILITEEDDEGKMAADYCRQLHPDLLSILNAAKTGAVENTKEVGLNGIINPVLAKWHVELPKNSCSYQANTHDFGIEIQELLFAKPNTDSPSMKKNYETTGIKIDHFVKNLRTIAEEQGFKLSLSNHQYALRDGMILLPDGTYVVFSILDSAHKAIEKCESKALVDQSKATYRTDHLFFQGNLGAAFNEQKKVLGDLDALFGSLPSLRFYMEGGNYYLSSDAHGKLKLLMGEDHLFIALNQFRQAKVFDDPEMSLKSLSEKIARSLTSEKIQGALSEMYSQGLLKASAGCEKGLITQKEIAKITTEILKNGLNNKTNTAKNIYLETAKNLKYYHPLNLSNDDLHNSKLIVAKYLAQKEITKALIAKSFSLFAHDLHFLPPCDYHLDTFLRPGPQKSFFVQNYLLVIELLKAIAEQAKELELTETDCQMIERYLLAAHKLNQDLAPLLQQTQKIVTEAGFSVIPTPGVFYDSSPTLVAPHDPENARTYNLNFLNAITGWSSKTKEYYYIATGAQVGNKLGTVLMDTYRLFLESYQKNIRVYYIGHDPENPTDFSEGMRWWNRRGSQAGPHCFGIELKTALHSTE